MKEDPFDPQPDNNWAQKLFIGTLVAATVVGIWYWANCLLGKAFHP